MGDAVLRLDVDARELGAVRWCQAETAWSGCVEKSAAPASSPVLTPY